MLRPDKKYSVYDLRQLKGKRCLTHVHVKSPEEAGAAEAAGIDLLSCSFDSPASQARLPLLVAAAVVGHLGMVPRHATWTNVRPIGKTAAEARQLYEQMKRLENAGAYAAELELVPHQLASYFCKKTSLLLMSLGSGSGCDTQFLFSDDILQDYDERIPRHAKAYRNFLNEYKRLQDERIAAFAEYAEDVKSGRFPEAGHLVAMDEAAFKEAVEAIEGRRGNA
ncbi:MAG: ketopantoate hydroxymethyltransferase [Verrucomicrobia bacterium]|nr:MAG: ketopantoate hydroxymethyltransferase [Verrucomicrobiota bacterium]